MRMHTATKPKVRWTSSEDARLAHIITCAQMDFGPGVKTSLVHLALDGEAFVVADMLSLILDKDASKSRADLDKGDGPRSRFHEALFVVFNHADTHITHIDPEDPIILELKPTQLRQEWPLDKLITKFKDLRTLWDVCYSGNYTLSGNHESNFWDFCQVSAHLPFCMISFIGTRWLILFVEVHARLLSI